jgi:hypothetical protein
MSRAPFRSKWLETPRDGDGYRTDTTDTGGGVSGVSAISGELQRCFSAAPPGAKAELARRFVALDAAIPAAVIDDVARWATWRRYDRLVNEALAAGDLLAAEAHVTSAERWAREARSTPHPGAPAGTPAQSGTTTPKRGA